MAVHHVLHASVPGMLLITFGRFRHVTHVIYSQNIDWKRHKKYCKQVARSLDTTGS